MTVPIQDAYAAHAALVAGALVAAGALADPALMQVDPTSVFEHTGDEVGLVVAAALLQLDTRPVRQLLGLPAPRYVVERYSQLELIIAGGDGDAIRALATACEAAIGPLPDSDRTLGATAERFTVGAPGQSPATRRDLPPNGVKLLFAFTIRVRSGDPLGMTP